VYYSCVLGCGGHYLFEAQTRSQAAWTFAVAMHDMRCVATWGRVEIESNYKGHSLSSVSKARHLTKVILGCAVIVRTSHPGVMTSIAMEII
jgi:hypothetical protein